MNIGMIAGESFCKDSSLYIANLITAHATTLQHKIFILNRTPTPLHIPGTTEFAAGKFFYERKIANLVKKNSIERLLIFNGNDRVDNTVAQIIINPLVTAQRIYENMNNISMVITFSEIAKQELTKVYPQIREKIFIANPVVEKGLRPLHFEERLAAKQECAGGKEYFVYAGFENGKEKFMGVLKAFSAFKKMQQSNWKLAVLLPAKISTAEKEKMLQPLASFKFREDITIINSHNKEMYAQCLGGAYALISIPAEHDYDPSVFEALTCNVPVISTQKPATEYAGAVCETATADPVHIAEKMMELYKNETLRSWLSQKAAEIMAGFDTERNISELVNMIIKR